MKAVVHLFAAVWRYSYGRHSIVFIYLLLITLANSIYLIEPYVIGSVLNTIQQARSIEHPFLQIVGYLLQLVGLKLLFWILHGPARVMEVLTAYHVYGRFIAHQFAILTSLPISWHREHHSGMVSNRVRKSSSALYHFTSHTFHTVEMIVRLVGSVVVLAWIVPTGAFLAGLVSLSALWVVFKFDQRLLQLYDALNQREHLIFAGLSDYIANIFTVISLRLERLSQLEISRRVTERSYLQLGKRMAVTQELKWFVATLMVCLMIAMVLSWYAHLSIDGIGLPLAGTVFMVYEYLQKIGEAFYTFAMKYSMTVEQYADLHAADLILKAEAVQRDEAIHLPQGWHEVKIEQLEFTYRDPHNHKQQLNQVSIELRRGHKIALVGESGSGKSTLLTLIRGIETTDQVRVSCDQQPLPYGLRHLAPHVTLIPQNPEIFSNTVEYNISVGTEISQEELMRDIEMAQFLPILHRLPEGTQTHMAERGVNLSGGEKQRLALARGLFAAKNSEIILLDEPTSAIDSQNELKIYRNLFSYFHDRCIVSSIHKLHLLPMFDEIYVLDQGEVRERGSLTELLQQGGQLAALWHAYIERKEKGG